MRKKIICFILAILMILTVTGCSKPSEKLMGSNEGNSIILLQYGSDYSKVDIPNIEIPENYILMSSDTLVYAVLNDSSEIVGYKKIVLDETTGQHIFKDCDANGSIIDATKKLNSIKFSQDTYEVEVEGTIGLSLFVDPLEYIIVEQEWASSDTAILTVNETGVISALAVGTATVTVTIDGITATCTVNVIEKPTEPVKTTEITVSKSSVSLFINENATITATVKPDDAANKEVTWTSSNTSVATVINGVITAHKEGTATITATASGGQTAECKVTVKKKEEPKPTEPTKPKDIATTGISIDKGTLTLDVGGTATITATVSPSNATDKSVKWSTSDNSVVTVNNGKITAVGSGTATITAKSSGGQTATCKVTVKKKVESFSWETISQSACPLDISDDFDQYILSGAAKNVSHSKGGYTYVMLKASGSNKISVVSVTESNGKVTIKYSNTGTSNYVFIRFNRENVNITYTT